MTWRSAEPYFTDLYLKPALLQRPALLRWLEPVVGVQGVMCAHLLTCGGGDGGSDTACAGSRVIGSDDWDAAPAPAGGTIASTTQPMVSLDGATGGHPLAALAGAGTSCAVWDAVMRNATALVAARVMAVASGVIATAAAHGARSPTGPGSSSPGGAGCLTSLMRSMSIAEAHAPPLTAVITFDDFTAGPGVGPEHRAGIGKGMGAGVGAGSFAEGAWKEDKEGFEPGSRGGYMRGGRTGIAAGEGAWIGVGEGGGSESVLRVVLQAISYPAAPEGSACLAVFCVSGDGGGGGGGGGEEEGKVEEQDEGAWPARSGADGKAPDRGDREEFLRRYYFPRSYGMARLRCWCNGARHIIHPAVDSHFLRHKSSFLELNGIL